MKNNELEAIKEKYAGFIASLSDENKAKVDACKTVDELMKLVSCTRVALPDDVLEAVAGGSEKGGRVCPECGSDNVYMDTTVGRFRCIPCDIWFD